MISGMIKAMSPARFGILFAAASGEEQWYTCEADAFRYAKKGECSIEVGTYGKVTRIQMSQQSTTPVNKPFPGSYGPKVDVQGEINKSWAINAAIELYKLQKGSDEGVSMEWVEVAAKALIEMRDRL